MGPTSSNEHITRHLLNLARYRAKKYGTKFDIDPADIHVPAKCPVMGVRFFSGNASTHPSLDRLRPERGYVRGNVIVVSLLANTVRATATPDQIMRVALYYMQMAD